MDVDLEVKDLDPGAGNDRTDETLIPKIRAEETEGDKELEGGEAAMEVVEGESTDVVGKDKSSSIRTKDNDLYEEDMDVDIDDTGDAQTVFSGKHTAVAFEKAVLAVVEEEIGNGADSDDKFGRTETSDKGGSTVAHFDAGSDKGAGDQNTRPESEDEEVDIGGHDPNQLTTNAKSLKEGVVGSGSSEGVLGAKLPAENKETFSVNDLVWGKVRSHPWWPGQIFDPSHASDEAMKHHKEDCYLVAFFGDRTFAWSEASQLKHFQTHFSDAENEGSSETFLHAVSCALEEVSRRVELGLACPCLQPEAYEKLRCQIVENTGIQGEASKREGIDNAVSADLFETQNLLQYLKTLAQAPTDGSNQLELVTAKAQLLAFYRLKGYGHLPEYHTEGVQKNESSNLISPALEEEETPVDENSSVLKRKHNVRDVVYVSKRERGMPELMDEDYEDDGTFNSSKRQKVVAFTHDSSGASSNPKQSFKIGACIVRAASQLTGSPSPSLLKCKNEKSQKVDESNEACLDSPSEYENPDANAARPVADAMLSQLQSVAREPMKAHGSLNNITSFFSTVRNNTLSAEKASDGRKRKAPKKVAGSPETFEFEDMKDSYWTDRVIQNGAEEKPDRKERKLNYQIVTLEPQPSRTPRVHSRKRYSNGNHKIIEDGPKNVIDKSKQDLLPAELILSFPDVDSVPSESKLNNIFRRFGPLKEFETEVDRENNRARVVFKRSSDADVAYSSVVKFSIFGSTVVHYEINYTPSVSYKAARIHATQNLETGTLPKVEFASAHDLEFITMQELEDATMQDMQYTHAHDLGVTMQDLEFTNPHDLEYPGPQDLDIVSDQVPEVTTVHSINAQDKKPAVVDFSEIPSTEELGLQATDNVAEESVPATQDMEMATAEEPGVNPDRRVQETEAFVGDLKDDSTHYVETVPEVESEAAQEVEFSGQEGVATQDVISLTTGGEENLKDRDSISAEPYGVDEDTTECPRNGDDTEHHDLDGGTGDPLLSSQVEASETIHWDTSQDVAAASKHDESEIADKLKDAVAVDTVIVTLQEPDNVEKDVPSGAEALVTSAVHDPNDVEVVEPHNETQVRAEDSVVSGILAAEIVVPNDEDAVMKEAGKDDVINQKTREDEAQPLDSAMVQDTEGAT